MTNGINLASLGFGGIDTSTLLSSLVSLDAQPMNQLQQQQQNIQDASSTISAFSSALNALSTAASPLSDPTTFGAMSASSSSSSVVASATGQPPAGQWSVTVNSVAQAQRTLSNGFSSSSAALGATGTLGLTVGGQSAQISVTSGESLSSVASAISSAGIGVSASVMYDGSQYHLVVSGNATGASNAVSFDESQLTGASLGLSTPANTIQQAQDASLVVGGVPVTSASNLVTDAIPGVSLAITAPTTSPSTITISSDTSSVTQQVQAFVSAYNQVVALGHADAGYGSQTASNTLLQGDLGVNGTLDQLAEFIGGAVGGTSGQYTSLGSVGLALNTDGTLSLNTSTLTTALQADPSSVEALFSSNAATGHNGVMGMIQSAITSLVDPTQGSIGAEIASFQTRTQSLGKQIVNMQSQITAYQTQLQTEFSQMNATLAQYKQIGAQLTAQFNTGSSSNSSGA